MRHFENRNLYSVSDLVNIGKRMFVNRSKDLKSPLSTYILRHYLTRIRCLSDNSSGKLIWSDIDAKWSKKWKEILPTGSLHPSKHLLKDSPKSFYCLSMFPYPSGILHMGHLRVYVISDVIARYKRFKGYNVIHPMGWDAFGLPAENAAVERGINPAIWTNSNIGKMKDQIGLMMSDFDWDREISTCSPEYYKWTQKIFLLLLENNMAYRKNAEINWDPVDQTVLANEQVDSEGRSWRSGAIVEKKNLEQWFIRITEYAELLNKDLNVLKGWPEKVKSMQRHWIGESHGAEITFKTTDNEFKEIKIFTSRPDTLFSVQFLAVSMNHPLVKKAALTDPALQSFIERSKELGLDSKEGYLLPDVKVSIPINFRNEAIEEYNIPVYAAPYVLDTYGHGSVMGCPGHDERDFEFWKLQNPEAGIIQVVGPVDKESAKGVSDKVFTDKECTLYDKSVLPFGLKELGEYNGISAKDASERIISVLESLNLGSKSTQYRIRDWLISRQRYWGAPIPVVHCKSCGPVPVPDEELPVLLPKIDGSSFGKGNPLTKIDSFVNTKCPSCGGDAKRDTDTMDTFIDSSWYFFRYTDPKNEALPFDKEMASKSIPIDLYIGGVEHAILHLLYSRFIAKFLGDIGMWDGKQFMNEPIKQLVTQGMVQGKTYTDPENGRFLKPEEVDLTVPNSPKIRATGNIANVSYEKMSKSKYNGADPETCIKTYGADVTRAHMLFQAPLSDSLNWNEDQILGTDRWLRKVVALEAQISQLLSKNEERSVNDEVNEFENIELNGVKYDTIEFNDLEFNLFKDAQNYIERISNSIEVDLSFNTIISDYMKFTNSIQNALKSEKYVNPLLLLDCYKKLLIVMSPVTPCTADECWEKISRTLNQEWKSIFFQLYPEPQKIVSPFVNYNVFINGKARHLFKGLASFIELKEDQILQELLKINQVLKSIQNLPVKRMILKPGLISIITEKSK